MFKEIDKKTWGHRFSIKKAIESYKASAKSNKSNTSFNKSMSSLNEKSVINSLNKSLNFSFSKSLEHSRSVNISTSEEPLQCDVCDGTTQHFCIICNKNVSNILSSERTGS